MNEDYLNTCHGNNDKLVKQGSDSHAIRYWSIDNCFEQSSEKAREKQQKTRPSLDESITENNYNTLK